MFNLQKIQTIKDIYRKINLTTIIVNFPTTALKCGYTEHTKENK